MSSKFGLSEEHTQKTLYFVWDIQNTRSKIKVNPRESTFYFVLIKANCALNLPSRDVASADSRYKVIYSVELA